MAATEGRAGQIRARVISAVAGLLGAVAASQSAFSACPTLGAAVQVLGSGGPMHGGGRGSSAYLFWYNSEPLFLIDIGGDTPTALSRAGVKSGSIAALLISHVHPDHVSGLPDYLWGEMTADRSAPLAVIAPPAGDRFLDAPTLFKRLFGPDGVYPDMQSLMTASPFPIRFTTADKSGTPMLEWRGFEVTAMRVDHGRAPALAFRINGRGFRVVFAGDQRALDPGFSTFASESDILVLHAMARETVRENSLSRAIAAPTDLGKLAARARAKHVVLGHFMQSSAGSPNAAIWSLSNLAAVIAAVRSEYQGPISIANDLECFPLRRKKDGDSRFGTTKLFQTSSNDNRGFVGQIP